ncbi:MAG TPA: hypothetical protein VGB53_04660 [Rubricoccaceae bacterium]|jgi:hypothetical protein
MTPPTAPLRPLERAAIGADVVIGALLVGAAGYLIAAAYPVGPHGGAYEMLAAVVLGPPGVLLLVAAVGVARRWRARWWLHALPLLWPAGLYAAAMAGGLLR